ncbi:hypothetical protein TNCV_2484411 [Trichonephila clavipes]|uniref:Uncharacterized protein n=1 Tax=Trichonephila clavipes TaxID=2585209 RepID=A0A8X7BAS2_TRICX|nr:hypothetical protein TNCV_2484411 [Trichonephila clavipes]
MPFFSRNDFSPGNLCDIFLRELAEMYHGNRIIYIMRNEAHGCQFSTYDTFEIGIANLVSCPEHWHCFNILSETWLGNESDISIPNCNCIVRNKRPNTRAGGVAIYQNSSDAVNIITPSMECSVSQSDIYSTIESSVGDLCLAECVIDNGQKL